MGSRLHGNDGPAAAHPTIVIPATAGIHGGGRRWVPVSTGTTGRRRRTPQSSFPRRRESTGGPAMGSRLHGNDGPAAGAPTIVIPTTAGIHGPTSSFPRRRESTAGAGDGFPSPRERRAGGGALHNRHSRDGGNPRRGAGDGFPSPRERRRAAGAPTIVIPATAGIHAGGPAAMGSRLHGNDGPAAGVPTIVIPATAGIHAGGPAMGIPSPRERRTATGAPTIHHPRRGGAAVTLEPVLHPRLSRERRPLHNSRCGRQCGGDG